jgi:flagellar basal-body rod protein FlgF
MVKGIYHSAAAMIANQHQLEVVSNNLANANTVGFKEERTSFRNTLNNVEISQYPTTAGEKFVRVEGGISPNNHQGVLQETDNPLDAAITGEGYFAVQTPSGIAYTRDGRFQLNDQGQLVNLDGDRVLTEGGSASFPNGDLRIGSTGELLTNDPNSPVQRVYDRLQVVTFSDPASLQPLPSGLYTTNQPALPLKDPHLSVGSVESSNVNIVSQMVEMIMLSRLYEASARSVQTQDGTLGKAVNEVGKVF